VAGLAAIGAGVAGLAYAVAFVVLQQPLLHGLFLMLGGLLMIVVLAGLSAWVRTADDSAARLGLIFAAAGALGAAAHGGYDLANAITPPPAAGPDLPFPADPRGLLTFGAAGLGTLIFSVLLRRVGARGLGNLGLLLGVLQVMIYIARLTVLSPANPLLLIPVLLAGFAINPVWLVWLGAALRRRA
jgi:hypothetical protein